MLGNVYNIPIAMWIPREFPGQPPTVYVVPTPTMEVRPNKHVDAAGKVYHLYLNQWAMACLYCAFSPHTIDPSLTATGV